MYKDRDWLYNEYFLQRRSSNEIANDFNVNGRTVRYFINKYGIPKPKSIKETRMDIKCHECKKDTTKSLWYLLDRIRQGKTKFFCTDDCASKNHSNMIKGSSNPNYAGKFNGTHYKEWSEIKRKEFGRKISLTMIKRGTSSGINNARWCGGKRKVNCNNCGNEYQVSPYIWKAVDRGDRKSFCSNCSIGYARTQQKTKRTSIEIKMAKELKERGIEAIEQYNLGNKFSLDFFLPSYNTVIECDGDYWHNLPEVSKRDKSKDAYIKACGHQLFRFWEHQINEDVGSCVDKVIHETKRKEALNCR